MPYGVLDKLHSGMSYSAGGCEFNASESTTYTNYIYRLVCMCVFSPGAVAKNPPANAEDTGSNPGLGRSPRGGNHNPLQHSCWDNPMDRGAWWVTVHGIAKSQTQLNN